MIDAGRRQRSRSVGGQSLDLRAERRVALFAGAVMIGAVIVWISAGLSSVLSGHGLHDVKLTSALALLFGVASHPKTPSAAFPARLRADVASAVVFWSTTAGITVVSVATCWVFSQAARRTRSRSKKVFPAAPTGWATAKDLAPLVVAKPSRGRVVVGRTGRRLVATETGHSLLVVGPTQSGKTTGLAIPAILAWDGPVVATSVKTDLVRATAERRRKLGAVSIYDPLRVSGSARASWSPLMAAGTWAGARRVAASLCSVQRDAGRSPEDAAFWGTLAEKLLAPMLFAAAHGGKTMREVVGWIDTGEVGEVLDVLEQSGDANALSCARAGFSREERQLASVYATAEAAISAFGDPAVGEQDGERPIEPARIGGGGSDTCYLVAPAHEQQRLRPVFVALLREILDSAFTVASRRGRLDPPLLVVLDEAANIAPVSNLDSLASTAASHGIQLVTVWQDFAQIAARYGPRAATVVNNHRAKLVFPGVSDPETLEQFSKLIGDGSVETESVTTDAAGLVSETRSDARRSLVSAADLRTLAADEAILLYGRIPPVRLVVHGGRRAARRTSGERLPALVRRGRSSRRP